MNVAALAAHLRQKQRAINHSYGSCGKKAKIVSLALEGQNIELAPLRRYREVYWVLLWLEGIISR
jgi:hypothetical protein